MDKIQSKTKYYIKRIPVKAKQVLELFLATDIPLYSANASFFLIITGIPISMILFSLFSLIPYVKIEDITVYINNLFPDLTSIEEILKYISNLAKSLSSTSILSTNILVAISAGSTAFYSFIIGIRKIHNITYRSNFISLRILALISIFFFFIAIILIILFFLLGSMILKLVNSYVPFLYALMSKILSLKYIVAFTMLLVVMLSIYTTSTNHERKIKHNIVGAIIATALWLIVSNLFSFYFSHFSLNASVYGSLSGIVVFLLWLYICMNILYLGAVINEVYIPEEKIVEARNIQITNEFISGNDIETDKELDKIYQRQKIKKHKRPNYKDYN
ncbi:MAG: YihY/virulence factor BrkB family protein [Lachnospiraceae bacterium]|nr:YihY/virulence factor BrkB family protein [Lachnospiraceae bacterium]